MVRSELVARSPLRILEQSTHGGLGPGNLGVIAARKGVGKTAFLVHLATDRLLQGEHVIHVSFSASTGHIIDWYEDIFIELARLAKLENARDIHDEAVTNRVIMNFNQRGIHVPRILKSLKAMINDGGFNADLVVVDSFDFNLASPEEIREFRLFAEEMKLEIWLSATTQIDSPNVIPSLLEPVLDEIAIVILAVPRRGHIHLQLTKDHSSPVSEDLQLTLNPKTLLISQD